MMENKNHWYDGLFYDLFIAPHQDKVFAQVKEILTEGSTLLDVGCGTGRLASQLLDKCDRIVIIDPSERNINIARKKLAEVPAEKLLIKHADAFEFLVKSNIDYDFAVVSYVLHEIEKEGRDLLLFALATVATKIIIVDYLVPQPRNYCGLLNELVEYAAGTEHYRNFKSFVKGNGLPGLLEKVRFKVIGEVQNQPCSSHIFVVEGKSGRGKTRDRPRPKQNTTINGIRGGEMRWRQMVKERVSL